MYGSAEFRNLRSRKRTLRSYSFLGAGGLQGAPRYSIMVHASQASDDDACTVRFTYSNTYDSMKLLLQCAVCNLSLF